MSVHIVCSKTCVKRPLCIRPKIGFPNQLSLNADQKYCRMLLSTILSTFIKPTFGIKIVAVFTGFTVFVNAISTFCKLSNI